MKQVEFELNTPNYREGRYAETGETIPCVMLLVTTGQELNYLRPTCWDPKDVNPEGGICACHHAEIFETIHQLDKDRAPLIIFVGTFSESRMNEIRAICQSYFVQTPEVSEPKANNIGDYYAASKAEKYVQTLVRNMTISVRQEEIRRAIEKLVEALDGLDKMKEIA